MCVGVGGLVGCHSGSSHVVSSLLDSFVFCLPSRFWRSFSVVVVVLTARLRRHFLQSVDVDDRTGEGFQM